MTLVAPGTCRYCNCTESNACKLEDGEPCCWVDRTRTVCSNPACVKAEGDRIRKVNADCEAQKRARRLTSADVHRLITGRGRRRRGGRR